jgi:hypothetical protein
VAVTRSSAAAHDLSARPMSLTPMTGIPS